MTTIRIADVTPAKEEGTQGISQDAVSSAMTPDVPIDSVYNIRSQTRPGSRGHSVMGRHGNGAGNYDNVDEDPGLRKPGDFKQKQVTTPFYGLSFELYTDNQ